LNSTRDKQKTQLKASPIDWIKLKAISGCEHNVEELKQLDKEKKYEQNMQDLWDTIKRPNT
jgi:hypothetical protein